jgi:hypothetical protein
MRLSLGLSLPFIGSLLLAAGLLGRPALIWYCGAALVLRYPATLWGDALNRTLPAWSHHSRSPWSGTTR